MWQKGGRNTTNMKTQNEKSAVFRTLHERSGVFVIPNPWDVGSAKLLEREGFEALATSSAGCALARATGHID